MVQWKLAGTLKGNDPIGDTLFLTSMFMGGKAKQIFFVPQQQKGFRYHQILRFVNHVSHILDSFKVIFYFVPR